MKSLVVLDFTTGEVHCYSYTLKELLKRFNDNLEEFIEYKGHRIKDCQWMCAEKLILQIH